MFKKLKGQQWKSIVSKKSGSASDKDIEVQINIGLMVWSDKNMCIKPKRGKESVQQSLLQSHPAESCGKVESL